MFLIDAKDDGFLETVVALLEKAGDFPGDKLGAVVNNEGAVKILGVIDTVLDLIAFPVGVAPLRPIALDIEIDMDFDDLVGSQESVLDALLERVSVNRLPEIIDVRDVFGFLGVAVRPICVAAEKYSRISRQAASSAALPR